jgi:hypothetical protein
MKNEKQNGILTVVEVTHQWNYKQAEPERNSGLSLTIPNQALTMRQIMDRFARGIPLDGQLTYPFADDEMSDDDLFETIQPANLDFAELEVLKQRVKETIDESQSRKKRRESKSSDEPPPPPPTLPTPPTPPTN